MSYRAAVNDYSFLLEHVVDFDALQQTERFADVTGDVVSAILTEAGKLSSEILAPLNRAGDEAPTRLENGVMRSAPGYAEGYRAIAEGGWVAVGAPEAHGGMGLPQALAQAINDMMAGACLSLQLNPLLTQGQIEALTHHASDEIKALYLPKLISGEWSGTMNLSEPQAGSDVGALKAKAEDNGDGTYSITGTKIWITWGDADFVENVCHLVLARLPGAPEGTKGISLFLVPRHIPDADGNPGVANSLKVVSIEEKLGIHGSPTCVMDYDGAKGWLVGPEGGGMAAMFTMMNNARLGVGMQGVGVAEAAYQHAHAYAMERVQGRTNGPTGAIIDHADVRRMLTEMKADIFASRAIGLACAMAIDMAEATGDAAYAARAAVLTPIAKAFGSDVGNEVAYKGVQIFGGMGFVEETGAAQFMRDARITPIYEGTNGIQAMDLVARKMMDGGEAAGRLMDEIEAGAEKARDVFPRMADAVWQACETLREATEWLTAQKDMNDRFAGAVPYLRAFARVLGASLHLQAAVADPKGPREKLARFYITRLLPEHVGLLAHAQMGKDDLFSLTAEELAV